MQYFLKVKNNAKKCTMNKISSPLKPCCLKLFWNQGRKKIMCPIYMFYVVLFKYFTFVHHGVFVVFWLIFIFRNIAQKYYYPWAALLLTFGE